MRDNADFIVSVKSNRTIDFSGWVHNSRGHYGRSEHVPEIVLQLMDGKQESGQFHLRAIGPEKYFAHITYPAQRAVWFKRRKYNLIRKK